MEGTERAWAEIDLDAIAHNVRQIKSCLAPGVKLMGVVKADAYGHGVEKTAEVVLENGADCLAVACIDEAIQLRHAGFKCPVLILGFSSEETVERLLEDDITPAVFSYKFAKQLSDAAVMRGKTAKIHIKVDTGMFRIGFLCGDDASRNETVKQIIKISRLPNIELEGIFTHLSTADEKDTEYSHTQFQRFCDVVSLLEKEGLHIPIKHCANSAGLIRFPEMQLDMVRAGIVIYGLRPSLDVSYKPVELKPAMKFKTRIINIKEVAAGSGISYGRTFTAKKALRVATLPVGYADGYSRLLSDKAEVSLGGVSAKQIGRICMDQCMIDVTDVNNINIGDEVTLFGDSVVTADSIAEKMGTINYEVACMVGKRIPRVYIRNGKTESCLNNLV